MKKLADVAVIIAGLVGLYLNIEYSGWVLLVGIISFL